MTSTQFLMVNPLYDMSGSFTDASTNTDYQANTSRNFINLIGDISNVDVSNTLYEGKTYDPSLSLVQFVKKTKKNFLDSNVNTMLDNLLYWARNTSGQNKFPILKTSASGDSSEQQTLPQPVANPYFTSATAITTNSDWPDGSGFEISHSSFNPVSYTGWQAFRDPVLAANDNDYGWISDPHTSTIDEWVSITYPEPVLLKRYVLTASTSLGDFHPPSWKMQGSNDGGASASRTWTDIGSLQIANPAWVEHQVTEINVSFNTVKYASYRVLCPNAASQGKDGHRMIRYIQLYTSNNS